MENLAVTVLFPVTETVQSELSTPLTESQPVQPVNILFVAGAA